MTQTACHLLMLTIRWVIKLEHIS
ncbi:hypothetical protein AGR7A_Lc120379 [Agrobacterium deltaense NCPPB 1641]|uniref:Uncharacterized protein n=1 Tax=Agrobacterium deltaense NCPPB 1641 TaxID=1183425 RepID=A0A1S7TWW7_9HYPH|nr:hypothetical protein AGR7A_Lc120379 [Agrobacterium deltaense NCPPB 1641]